MLWRFSHTTVMPNCTVEQASALCVNPEHFLALQGLISQNLKIQKEGDVAKNPPLTESKETILKMLAGKERPTNLPWPALPNRPEEFAPMNFEMTDARWDWAKVIGSQFFYQDQNVALFHSIAVSAKIEQWKLRLVYEEDGKVKVSETVWGDVPALVCVPLNATGIPAKMHTKHMELYPTLLPAQTT